ncbi:serine hydrolase domain-containing protein [Alkaliflexus imshenetskii]|uniref:serine hydrolase domain-containing protein n=1 Tax=Alkaliflexus imshenetskii TaxID=286730 RepID=UPI0004BC3C2E|nr:serine hydrolase [Alkaliflexus imshenetskii]
MKAFGFFIIPFLFLICYDASALNRHLFSNDAYRWADSVYHTLTLEQRVAQILMVEAHDVNFLKRQSRQLPQPGFFSGDPSILASAAVLPSSPLNAAFVPDVRKSFDVGMGYLPFPEGKTLTVMDEAYQVKLYGILSQWLVSRHMGAFISSSNYSDWVNGVLPDNKRQPPAALLWASNNTAASTHATKPLGLNVYQMPNQMINLMPVRLPQPMLILNQQFGKKVISIADTREFAIRDVSVEQLLGAGSVFISNDYENDLRRLVGAFQDRWLMAESLEKSCKFVLAFKYELYSRARQEVPRYAHAQKELDLRYAYESSIKLFQHEVAKPLPLTNLDVKVGFYHQARYSETFKQFASKYLSIDYNDLAQWDYDLIFWLADEATNFQPDFTEQAQEIKGRFPKAKIVMVWGGDPDLLPFRELPLLLDALLITPANTAFSWELLAQAAFNGIEVSALSNTTLFSDSMTRLSRKLAATRLKYGIPLEVGVDPDTIQLIDRIVEDAIKMKATPGARVLVARKGVVIYDKAFGHHTYDRAQPVLLDDIYDLASVTKVAATMPVMMKLYDMGRWRLSDLMSSFVPEAGQTDKRTITMRQLLLHESGLPAFIPFYLETIDQEKLNGSLFSRRRTASHPTRVDNTLFMNRSVTYRDDLYRSIPDLRFSVPVAQNIYLDIAYRDSMHLTMLNAKLLSQTYRYSDLNFILLQRIAESLTDESFDVLCANQFYNSLGAGSLMFNPWRTVPKERIVPTEDDRAFRRQLIHGYVHDQTAAMMGGVAGHAGLFGNANDLAKLMQMFLNNGLYGGQRYLNHETVSFFTRQQHAMSRRALGFDKPEPDPSKDSPVTRRATPRSFGHTGFSGTLVWVDPEYDLVYVFLSNRIHPESFNRKLTELKVRTRIHEVIYRAIDPLSVK